MSNIINAVTVIIVVIQLIINIIESVMGAGGGAAKKADVIKYFIELISKLEPYVKIPEVVKGIITNENILGVIIDVIVAIYNAKGFFVKSSS